MDNNYITVLKTAHPINKHFTKTEKTAGKPINKALATTVHVPKLTDLLSIMQEVSEKETHVIIFGFIPATIGLETYEIVTEENEDIPNKKWGRTKNNFVHSLWFLLDRDEIGGNKLDLLDVDGWFIEMEKLLPEISEAEGILVKSNSNLVEGFESNSFHFIARCTNVADLQEAGSKMLMTAFGKNLIGYKRSKSGSQLTRTIFDASTFSPERLSYEGKPTAENLKVSNQDFGIRNGKKLDLSVLSYPIEMPSGYSLKGNQLTNVDVLTDATEIETKDYEIATFESLTLNRIEGHIRCQTPFRDSDSMNAYISWHENGEPFLYDNGTKTKYMRKVEPVYDSSVTSALDAFRSLAVDDEDIKDIKETVIIRTGLLASGAITVLVAPPESGKTVIARAISGELAKKDHEVFYIDMDSPAGVAAEMQLLSKMEGWTYFNPDVVRGQTVERIKAMLGALAESGEDLHGKVFVVDTLKKLADMIQKSDLKKTMTLFRHIASLGASVLLLGHTNKYKGEQEGKDSKKIVIPEGTGDLAADSDCVLIVSSYKDEKRKKVFFSTITDKSRNEFVKNRFGFEPISGEMRIGKNLSDRSVIFHEEAIDVSDRKEVMESLNKDKEILVFLKRVVSKNPDLGQEELVVETHRVINKNKGDIEQPIGIVNIRKTLKAHSGESGTDYVFLTIRDNNRLAYEINPDCIDPFDFSNDKEFKSVI